MTLNNYTKNQFVLNALNKSLSLIVLASLIILSPHLYANPNHSLEKQSLELPSPIQSSSVPSEKLKQPLNLQSREFTIGRNQSLSHALNGIDKAPQVSYQISRLENAHFFTRLNVGDTLVIWTDENNQLHKIDLQKTRTLSHHLTIENDQMVISSYQRPVETRITQASANIDNSLYLAGRAAGLSSNSIMNLADIFAWEVDYSRELRAGNQLNIIYERQYLDNEYIGDGKILAAELIVGTRQRQVKAIRFEKDGELIGYFDDQGENLRKAFMRNPINYTRISSRFQKNRYHPVLQEIRDHKGVDYAAPTGTPIYAAGDGTIKFRGWGNGYGNYIIIQHAGRYETVYGHMSRFGKFRQGQQVKQGEVIGYVGMTGLATGPHLHYEFRIDGVHHDPLTVKFPNAEPIPKQYKQNFLEYAAVMQAQLERINPDATKLAFKFE
ncbi:peptidoglycan DD-metalloendopeptidase family protein [Thiomicrospira microaerophila]|uniref:M23 family metallopeptidase n=1 Tax=Thiomicrospira microaerophila TaxID=406020 RepID=UPI00200D5A2A|nr:peptidoglycan DD-metalloendopeptidase family protein [Thiomicrospira microaerophila]UQB42902.1 peptidoglycan DD-metalloendopeptidase family protein [Thiomicrospira microaerophila]